MLALAALAMTCTGARATEDTDTPGAGKWEININVAGERSAAGWEYVLPETEFNYGFGERVQLVLGIPYMALRETGVSSQYGFGTASTGFKWRLVDQAEEDAGFSMAVMPIYNWNLSDSAERRGLVDPGPSLVLPLLVGMRRGDMGYFAEAGRVLVKEGPSEWLAGIRVTNKCHAKVECRVEVQHNLIPRQTGHTLASVGFKWAVAEDLILQGSLGRDLGPSREEKHQFAFKFGVQLLR
jgi:hypothetical protein